MIKALKNNFSVTNNPEPLVFAGHDIIIQEKRAQNRSVRSRVRPFTPDDIPEVANIIIQTFSFASKLSSRQVSDALEKVIFHNPWVDENLPSLIYEHSDGSIQGFMGVSPRGMSFNGEPVTLAITHNFVVMPGFNSFMIALKLFKTMLAGPQDLVVSGSAGDATRLIVEKTGGTIAYSHSYYWRLPLRPLQCSMDYLGRKRIAAGFASALVPAAIAGDFMLNHLAGIPVRRNYQGDILMDLSATDLVNLQDEFSERYALRPAYSPESLQWVLTTAAKADHLGKLVSQGVYDSNEKLIGWFILFLNPGGTCEVLQLKARKGKESQILENLIYYTRKEGALELIGRMEPDFIRPISQSWALCQPGRMWMLLHGRRIDMINSICRGDAFISRLEDDIWLL